MTFCIRRQLYDKQNIHVSRTQKSLFLILGITLQIFDFLTYKINSFLVVISGGFIVVLINNFVFDNAGGHIDISSYRLL